VITQQGQHVDVLPYHVGTDWLAIHSHSNAGFNVLPPQFNHVHFYNRTTSTLTSVNETMYFIHYSEYSTNNTIKGQRAYIHTYIHTYIHKTTHRLLRHDSDDAVKPFGAEVT
jgi:hypothetical protein